MNTRGFRERTIAKSFLADATRETLYTCPNNCRARVVFISLNNVAGNVTVDLELYKASSNSRFYLLYQRSLPANDFLRFTESYIVLEPGDRLEARPDGPAPRVDAIVTVEEIFIPVG